MALTKIKLNTGMITGSLPDANIPDDITISGAQTGITSVGTLTGLTIEGDEQALIVKTADSGRVAIALQNSDTGSATNFTDGLLIKLDSDETGHIGMAENKALSLFTNGTNALTIDTSQNATFAGVVTASGSTGSNYIGSFTNTSATGWGLFVKGGADNADYALRVQDKDAGDLLSVKAGGRTGVGTNDPTDKFQINYDSDFYEVFNGAGTWTTKRGNGSTGGKVLVTDLSSGSWGSGGGYIQFKPRNSTALTIAGDGEATFASDVTVDGNRYMLTESGTNKGFFGKDDWATSGGSADNVNVGSYSGTVKITAGATSSSTSNIVCNTDKSTTFNGTVTIPSGSYVPDDHANFGIGAIVSNWGTAYDVLNVGHSSAYWCEVGDYADRGAGWGNNLYHNGSNYKSIYEDQVSAITQKGGNIKFYTAGIKGTTTNMTSPGDGDPRVTMQNDGATLFGTTTRTGTGVGGASFDPNSVGRCLLLLGSVNYTSSVDVARFYNDNGEVGDIRTDGSGASFNSNSDYRLKENEVPLSNALTRLNNLKPYRFNFKADKNKTLDGFFAHEVQEVVPEAVTGTKDQMKAIQYQPEDEIPEGKEVYDIKEYSTTEIDPQKMDASKLVPLLVASVQELSAKVEELEKK